MKTFKWITAVSITVVLVLSGWFYAKAYKGAPIPSDSQGGPVKASSYLSSSETETSPNYPGSSNGAWGTGMMGGYNSQDRYGGMMGGYNSQNGYNEHGGMMGGYGGYQIDTVNDNQVKDDETVSLANANVDKSNNSITYTGQDIKIVMLGGPEETDGEFVIDELINPTLYIPRGSKVILEFINEDESMPHGTEITNATPPYSYMPMMQGGIYPGSFIHPVPEANENSYPEAVISFTTNQAGQYYYICQYPGHAEKGMYGKIIIE